LLGAVDVLVLEEVERVVGVGDVVIHLVVKEVQDRGEERDDIERVAKRRRERFRMGVAPRCEPRASLSDHLLGAYIRVGRRVFYGDKKIQFGGWVKKVGVKLERDIAGIRARGVEITRQVIPGGTSTVVSIQDAKEARGVALARVCVTKIRDIVKLVAFTDGSRTACFKAVLDATLDRYPL
jgi:hypothetical protein